MVPTAIIAGFVLAAWLRWWTVAAVALGWAAVIGIGDPSSTLGAAALGAANGAVGAAAAIGLRRLLDATLRPDQEQFRGRPSPPTGRGGRRSPQGGGKRRPPGAGVSRRP